MQSSVLHSMASHCQVHISVPSGVVGTTLHPCECNHFAVSDKLDPKIHAAAQKSLQRVAKLRAEWATVN